jgi:hypothetical protein
MARWRDRPRDDRAADGADAFRYLSIAYRELPPPKEAVKPKPVDVRMPTLDEIVAESTKNNKYRRQRI